MDMNSMWYIFSNLTIKNLAAVWNFGRTSNKFNLYVSVTSSSPKDDVDDDDHGDHDNNNNNNNNNKGKI
jgi:hypothetical protein